MKIKCIAIEDEPLGLQKLIDFIKEVDYLQLVNSFDNAISALSFLKTQEVDLIFLDIRMKKLTGIEFLEALQSKPKVIITSAYDEYALKGYELSVSDYLLKPFSFERFLKSTEKAYQELSQISKLQDDKYIFVKTEHRIERITLDEILFIKGMKDYLQIVSSGKKIMTLQSFKKIQQILPSSEFVRIHNSYIVPISKIESIERNRVKIGDELIPVSGGYKKDFLEMINQKNHL